MKRHYYLFAYVLICCLPLCAQIDKEVDHFLNNSDLSGNTLSVIIDDELLDSGNHSFLLPEVTANVFLVQLLINGRVNIKKVYQP